MNLIPRGIQKLIAIVFAGAVLISTAGIAEETPRFLSVAVLDFETPDPQLSAYGGQMGTLVNTHLSMTGNIVLVEREELDKLLGEQELGLSGTVSASSAAQVGQLTGAKVLISGRAFMAGDELVAVARIMGTETSRVYGEMVTFPKDQAVTDVARKLADKIGATLTARADALVAPQREPEDVIAKLRDQLDGVELPSIAIDIPEEHLSRVVLDPAAETEIGRILGGAGFEIMPAEKADYVIDGEAFSELGMRRGNLVSCRARVEVNVSDRTSGRVVLMDRQTEVDVDISESVAAKNALQAAGARLAARIADAVTGRLED